MTLTTDYCEKAVEEEVVVNDFVAAIFDNKLFEKPHKSYLDTGVNILAHAPINIVETNKHFGKRWKVIMKIQHL